MKVKNNTIEILSLSVGLEEMLVKGVEIIIQMNKEAQEAHWQKQVIKLLTEINFKLDDISDQLKQLNIKLDEKFREFVNNDLLSTIDVVDANNDFWRRSKDKYLHTKETQEHLEKIYVLIQQKSRMAMHYGFAHFSAIALALRTEIYLCRLTKRDLVIPDILKQYLDYFQKCIDQKEEQSFAYNLKILSDQITSLNLSLVPGTFEITGEYIEHRIIYKDFVTITGNLINGFDYNYQYKVQVGERPISGGNQGGGGHIFSCLKLEDEKLFFLTTDQLYKQQETYYRDALLPNKSILEASIKELKQLIFFCQNKVNSFEIVQKELETTLQT